MKRLPLLFFVVQLMVSPAAPADSLPAEAFDFEVAPADEPAGATYTWHEALNVCEDKGMALPSIEDMARIFCHAKLDRKNIVSEYPETDKGCSESGISKTLPNFEEEGRYWTSSRYNDGVVRYIDFLDGRLGYYGKDERLHVRCIRTDDGDQGSRRAFPYDINDVDEESFDYIVDTIFGFYADVFVQRGKELVVTKYWEKEEENARSWFMEVNDREANQIRQVREIELVGGLARHPMLNRDAFAMVVCHEIGHHIGGAPRALGYSAEGQSDYFAASKCMKRYLRVTKYAQHYNETVPDDLAASCAASHRDAAEKVICRRNILAGLTLSRWIAHSRDVEAVQLTERDPTTRLSTLLHGYPAPQCRLDTLVAGALCPVDDSIQFSDDDARAGACTSEGGHDRGARPRCWFNMEDTDAAADSPT